MWSIHTSPYTVVDGDRQISIDRHLFSRYLVCYGKLFSSPQFCSDYRWLRLHRRSPCSAPLESDPSCKIHVLDINTEPNRFPSVTYYTYDISSADAVENTMQTARPRVIFHMACPDSMIVLPQLFKKVTVGGTRNLLSSASGMGTVQALIYRSTSSVIHDNKINLIDADETLLIL